MMSEVVPWGKRGLLSSSGQPCAVSLSDSDRRAALESDDQENQIVFAARFFAGVAEEPIARISFLIPSSLILLVPKEGSEWP